MRSSINIIVVVVIVIFIFIVTTNILAENAKPPSKKHPNISTDTLREITWKELIPAGLTREKMRKGKSIDEDKQFGIIYDVNIFKPRADLHGQLVRIGGFTLPLEMDGEKAVEFLLVPFVGACIHVPPPPPIQIIYVKFPEGYKSRALYDAVWVTGRLATKNAKYNLNFVDGEEEIQVGYSLTATAVTPIKI